MLLRRPCPASGLIAALLAAAASGETIRVWGTNSYGQAVVPAGIGAMERVASGSTGLHTVGIVPGGSVVAWGAGLSNSGSSSGVEHGQSLVPAGLGPVRSISAGGYHTLALLESGAVVAWGAGSQAAVSGVHQRQSIVPNDLGSVRSVSAGGRYSVAVLSSGEVRAWGDPLQLPVPQWVTNVVAASAGSAHTLVLRADGRVFSWGSTTSDDRNEIPFALPPSVAVAAGGAHSLALLSSGTVRAWGSNGSGQCSVPEGLAGVVEIEAGNAHSLALLHDGTVRAWGASAPSAVPPGLGPVSSIGAGSVHSIAAEHEPQTTLRSPNLVPFAFDLPRSWAATGIVATPGDDAELIITARGQLGSTTRFLTVKADGIVIGSGLFGAGSGAGLCSVDASTAVLGIPAKTFARMSADGVVNFRIESSLNATSAGCTAARLDIVLRYQAVPDDCDGNGTADSCQLLMDAGRLDCNGNGSLDACDIASGSSVDSNDNGIPDECEPDCDASGVPDSVEIANGSVPDCDRNGRPDSCDIAAGAPDVDGNGIPDRCASDCNGNGVPDAWECAQGLVADCDGDRVPDACELAAPLAAFTDVATGRRYAAFLSSTRSRAKAQAEAVGGTLAKIDSLEQSTLIRTTFGSIGGTARMMWIGLVDGAGTGEFRWEDGVLPAFTSWRPGEPNNTFGDERFVEMNPAGGWNDVADGGVPGLPYTAIVVLGTAAAPDCNANGLLDSCEIAGGSAADCNHNGIPDGCDISSDPTLDCNLDGVIDACQGGPGGPDCDGDGTFDICQIAGGAEDKNGNGKLDSCEYGWGDLNLDGVVDGIDLGGLLAIWGLQNPPYADLNDDGWVDGNDLGIMLAHWGPVP
jgi:alpha-tubulin suppressor-like RCC1 family protein